MIPRYDPLIDDLKDDSVKEDAAAPSVKNGYLSVVGDTLYYCTGNHRYKITATLDDPVAAPIVAGNPIGLLLTLTYPATP